MIGSVPVVGGWLIGGAVRIVIPALTMKLRLAFPPASEPSSGGSSRTGRYTGMAFPAGSVTFNAWNEAANQSCVLLIDVTVGVRLIDATIVPPGFVIWIEPSDGSTVFSAGHPPCPVTAPAGITTNPAAQLLLPAEGIRPSPDGVEADVDDVGMGVRPGPSR